jgi:hypothetical protein
MCNIFISQYTYYTYFMIHTEKRKVGNLVQILYSVGWASWFEINWTNIVAYWCWRNTKMHCLGEYQKKWMERGDLSNLFGTPFGLHIGLKDIDDFLVTIVKGRLKH